MNETKKEHYVPCCYLWNFSFCKNHKKPQQSPVYVFDKVLNKSFIRAVHDVASEYYFYDNEKLGDNKKFLEKFFSNHVEVEYSTHLKSLIDRVNSNSKNIILYGEKSSLSAHFAIQYIRTLAHRNNLAYMVEQLKKIVPQNSIYYDRIASEDYVKNLHNNEILGLKTANTFANLFEDKKWVIIVNKTAHRFCTSDNPICVINYGDSLGLFSPLCTIAIPISPSIMIAMVDKRLPINDCNVVEMTERKMIDYLNKKQYEYCIRCVYSSADDFTFLNIK